MAMRTNRTPDSRGRFRESTSLRLWVRVSPRSRRNAKRHVAQRVVRCRSRLGCKGQTFRASSTNATDHGDRAVEFAFRTEDAEVSRASDGSPVVLLEAALELAAGSTPAPPGYPTATGRATFRPRKFSSMGIGATKTPANHARPRRNPICDQIR